MAQISTVTQAVQGFLNYQVDQGNVNNADTLRRFNDGMEFQVNVSPKGGEKKEGTACTWTNGTDDWWHIRCPKNSWGDEPHWNDYKLNWLLDDHALAIGMTGWDWKNKRSRWFGFDFDGMTHHRGLMDEELEQVKKRASQIDFVETRLSTRGGGLHLYVYLDDSELEVPNHSMHAAMARSLLTVMGQIANFDFEKAKDVCGSNMWVWHREASDDGYELLNPAERNLTDKDIPAEWRQHQEVIKHGRTRVRVQGLDDKEHQSFDSVSSAQPKVELSSVHKEIIDDLSDSGFTTIWNYEHCCIQTHTCAFKYLLEKHPGKYKGVFDTISEGNNPGEANCFAWPCEDDSFSIYRFQGAIEHESWSRNDKNCWTYFNKAPSLADLARFFNGLPDADETSFQFKSRADIEQVLRRLDLESGLGDSNLYDEREFILGNNKRGNFQILMSTARIDEVDQNGKIRHVLEDAPDGWAKKTRNQWVKTFSRNDIQVKHKENNKLKWDGSIRLVQGPDGSNFGWWHNSDNEKIKWGRTDQTTIQRILISQGIPKPETESILGDLAQNRWLQVRVPFADEYPGNRQWNREAPQYAFQPAEVDYEDALTMHPSWDHVLSHIGHDLDIVLHNSEWAKDLGIETGRDYLMMWIACLLREPFDRLPYLFLYGAEKTGKSTLWMAIQLLIKDQEGVVNLGKILMSGTEFNRPLENALLGYVEEVDLNSSRNLNKARAVVKDLITNQYLDIRRMRVDTYTVRNMLHIIQTGNSIDFCLVTHGDTRSTVLHVPPPTVEIPWPKLQARLEDEAPYFMRSLLGCTLPTYTSRLRVAPVTTAGKEVRETSTMNLFQHFLAEQCHYVPGEVVIQGELFDVFRDWLGEEDRADWGRKKFNSALGSEPRFPTGHYHSGEKTFVGNISLSEPTDEIDPLNLLYRRDNRLVSKREIQREKQKHVKSD